MGRGKIDRTLLIKKASQLFIEFGYYNTTMDDIAKACNIQKSSLYHHIPSRKSLVLMMINQTIENTKQQLTYAYDNKLTQQERLYTLAKAIEQINSQPTSHSLMTTLTIEIADTIPEVGKLAKQYFEEWTNAIYAILQDVYGSDKAKRIAEDTIAHIQGAILLSKTTQNAEIFKRAIQQLQKLLPASTSTTTVA